MPRSDRSAALKVLVLAAVFWLPAPLAVAGDTSISASQIIEALKPKAATRGLSAAPQERAVSDRERAFLDTLRNRNTRSLSTGERAQIAELTSSRPKIDLEIQFDYNSSEISKASTGSVQALGKALSDPGLRGSTFVVAGHTDAIGSEAFNQKLSERRADAIKRYLVEKFGIDGSNLVTVGYGKTRLKNPARPNDAINRRVQVVNMEGQTASK